MVMKQRNISFWDDDASTHHFSSVMIDMKFAWVSITPSLVPVVPDEYRIASVSDWVSCSGGNSTGSQLSISSSIESELRSDVREVRRVGNPMGTNLCSSSGEAIPSLAPKSRACLTISD